MKRSPSLVDRVMAERIEVLGTPGVVVTRGYLYRFLVRQCGWNPCARGFASADYAAFGRPATERPLTWESPSEDGLRDQWMTVLAKRYLQEVA